MKHNLETLKKTIEFIQHKKVFDYQFYKLNYKLDLSDEKLIEHYLLQGESYGYQPNPIFSSEFFKKNYSGKSTILSNHFLEYLYVGAKYKIEPFLGFDASYISKTYKINFVDAMSFYVKSCAKHNLIKPNKLFNPEDYLELYPDIKAAKIDPYYHFVSWGANEGRLPAKDFSWNQLSALIGKFPSNIDLFQKFLLLDDQIVDGLVNRSSPAKLLTEIKNNHRIDAYEEHDSIISLDANPSIDVFAFYLTQFHQFKENDEWWGTGFTEWTNVVRGLPRYEGHYQPKIPADLGFYDLSNKETIRKQIDIAKKSGVTGFGFYYYHFGEKRLLEKPLNIFLDDQSLDIKFFYIWANETWSRRWDGSEKEILIEQTYPDDLVDNIVNDAVKAFDDKRYHKIDGRPLFVIYRVSVIPEWQDFIKDMRKAFKIKGHNPLIYMAQSFTDLDPSQFNLDGALEFPPHKYTRDLKLFTPEQIYTDAPDLKIYKYDDVLKFAKSVKRENFPLIRTCFPSWDNDARRQGNSVVIDGATTEKFKSWLNLIITETKARPQDPQMICINAWNEWGEGTYLEPDRRFGYANLNALKSVVIKSIWNGLGRILLVGHDAFSAGAQRLLLSLGETLKNEFETEITFLILRADKGYDGLLTKYKDLATTLVIDSTNEHQIDDCLANLQSQGYSHAIVNTAVSARILSKMEHSWTTIQLVHELKSILEKIGSKEQISEWFKYANKVIAPTKGVKNLLNSSYGVSEEKFRIIPQGLYRNIKNVDKDFNDALWLKKLNRKTKPKVIVGLGYADYRKGIDIFVQTCAQVNKNNEDYVFIWQGDWDPDSEKNLAKEVDELTKLNALYLEPASDDIESLIDFSDLLFLSSREDPLPTVAFEAWSLGKSVVAFSNTGGISDLIQDNTLLGYLVSDISPNLASDTILKCVKKNNSNRSDDLKKWVSINLNWYDYVYALYQELFSIPSVEIAVVGHNHADFVDQRIQSVKKQTLPSNKISYFDIGSDTRNLEILDTFFQDSKRVTFLKLPGNDGKLYESWLQFAEKSSSEYFHIAEADDVIDKNFIKKLVKAMSNHNDAAFAFSAVDWINANNEVINKELGRYVTKNFHLADSHDAIITPEKAFNSQFLVLNPILTISSTVWRRLDFIEAIKEMQNELGKITFAYDWLLYFYVFNKGKKSIFINERLIQHRQHANSMSANKNKHKNEIKKCYEIFDSIKTCTEKIDMHRKDYISSL